MGREFDTRVLGGLTMGDETKLEGKGGNERDKSEGIPLLPPSYRRAAPRGATFTCESRAAVEIAGLALEEASVERAVVPFPE